MDCDCDGFCQLDDQFIPATRELLVFTKAKDRYFDLDAVREAPTRSALDRAKYGYTPEIHDPRDSRRTKDRATQLNPIGVPPLDWWLIPYTDPEVPQPPGDTQMTATFYVGDAIETMNALPEKSVDLVLTSPPFLALRSYLPSDHPDKALEGGSQATPGAYIDWLLDVVEACARVLAPHGSLVFELGDTYSGSGGAGGDYAADGLREGQPTFRVNRGGRITTSADLAGRGSDIGGHHMGGTGWPLAKSLSLIPETFRFAMVYGHNPHTGRTTPPWRLRNVIRWVRPNPPVGALGDKFRPATSELMVFCKSKDRFFDLDAVREPPKRGEAGEALAPNRRTVGYRGSNAGGQEAAAIGRSQTYRESPHLYSSPAGAPPLDWWNVPLLDGDEETRYGPKAKPSGPGSTESGRPRGPKTGEAVDDRRHDLGEYVANEAGAPPLDWWNIPPGGYPGAHYAVWPPELLVKPIKAMVPEMVCRTCGQPRRRIVETTYEPMTAGGRVRTSDSATKQDPESRRLEPRATAATTSGHNPSAQTMAFGRASKVSNTLGFSDCGHDDWRPGLVLDCFGGSGTTAAVATGHGRDAVLIDLDERNYDLALDRVGPLILERGTEPARRINS